MHNHLYVSSLKNIFVIAKILILSYKISTYLCIYEDCFGVKILLRDDCTLILAAVSRTLSRNYTFDLTLLLILHTAIFKPIFGLSDKIDLLVPLGAVQAR